MFKKMCNDPRIQEMWIEPKVGDLFLQRGVDKGIVLKCDSYVSGLDNKTVLHSIYAWLFWLDGALHIDEDEFGSHTWLPSIEQLADMLKNTTYRIYYYLDSRYCLQIDSPFQSYKSNCIKTVLIQAVMHEKHSLRWTAGRRWE